MSHVTRRTALTTGLAVGFGGMGLRLIVNLLWLGFKKQPHVQYSDTMRGTRVTFPFPMERLPLDGKKPTQ